IQLILIAKQLRNLAGAGATKTQVLSKKIQKKGRLPHGNGQFRLKCVRFALGRCHKKTIQ
ncbi:hypothetical protein MLK62_025915, partial [Escherichia coli]|nr:hypothetical protein [Escherichia coli]